jgi:protein-tyrosine phosphatase
MTPPQTPDDARRHVPTTGIYNVRDLGGYRAHDGRPVRWGRVYRGGSVHSASAEDVEALRERGVRVICDLRSGPERVAAPNEWAARYGVEIWAYPDEATVGDSRRLLEGALVSADRTRALMARTYEHIPFEQAPSYAATFGRIAAGRLPLMFHCAAGKDRSGVAAALLLAALGVGREDVIADYLLSQRVRDRIEDAFLADPRHRRALEDTDRAWAPLMESDPAYITAMFRSVESRRGSVAAYFEMDLGIAAEGLAALREELLE